MTGGNFWKGIRPQETKALIQHFKQTGKSFKDEVEVVEMASSTYIVALEQLGELWSGKVCGDKLFVVVRD